MVSSNHDQQTSKSIIAETQAPDERFMVYLGWSIIIGEMLTPPLFEVQVLFYPIREYLKLLTY
jgi:hypothetical protein